MPPGPEDGNVCIPSNATHACTVRGIQRGIPDHLIQQAKDKDFRNLVKDCQIHSHLKHVLNIVENMSVYAGSILMKVTMEKFHLLITRRESFAFAASTVLLTILMTQ